MNGLWGKFRDFVGFPTGVNDDYLQVDEQDEFSGLYSRQARHMALSEAEDDESGFSNQSWRSDEKRRRSDDFAEASHRERRSGRGSLGSNMGSNVIGLPSVNQSISEVVVLEPHSFDEMAQVVLSLRDRKTVIMNLTLMDPVDAQRSVDFVAGGTYAIDGHQERIGENIFLFTPNCVTVTTPTSQPAQPPSQRTVQIPTPIWSTGFGDSAPAVAGQR